MIHLSWSVKRESGRPLLAADVDHYELTVKHDGAIALNAPAPAPADTSYDFDATDPGVYEFTLVCVPKKGGKSEPATGSAVLEDTSQVVIFNLTVEVIAP